MTHSRHYGGRLSLLVLFGLVALYAYWNLFWQLESTSTCSCETNGDIEKETILTTTTTTLRTFQDIQKIDISNFGGILPRAFDKWKHGQVPCLPPDPQWHLPKVQRSPAHQGLLLLKVMKTGGSTAAGIHLRIARNQAQKQHGAEASICKTRNDHGRAYSLDYKNRDRSKSFLWTILRDPTQRAISQFFHFEVSRNKVEPTDSNFQQWIRSNPLLLHSHYLATLSVDDVFNDTFSNNPVRMANEILQDYDFIGLTERMEESAVALQLLLGVTTGDILFMNAKGSGGFDDGSTKDKGCVYIVPSFVSPGMKAFFQTNEWKVLIDTDKFLHQAVDRSLDLTIERLGRAQFDRALQKFRHAMHHIAKTCLPNTTFPCTAGGEKTKPKDRDCLWYDSGCGTSCLDKVAEELDLYSAT